MQNNYAINSYWITWVTILFYSIMLPYWNLCEQRQDNWQDKENRIEFGENLRKIG